VLEDQPAGGGPGTAGVWVCEPGAPAGGIVAGKGAAAVAARAPGPAFPSGTYDIAAGGAGTAGATGGAPADPGAGEAP